MDPQRFDTLARSLHDRRSRRGALATLLGGTLGLLGLAETAGKRKNGKGKGKGKGKKKKQKPTCRDRTKNGSETDVDCGGSCARCANGKTCVTSNDCANACVSGTCQACTTSLQNCGSDSGGMCTCDKPESGGTPVCSSRNDRGAAVPLAISCEQAACSGNTVCIPSAPFGSYICAKPCGAP